MRHIRDEGWEGHSGCQSVPGSPAPAGDKSRDLNVWVRESQCPQVGETCHVEEMVGRQSSSQPPVGSSGRLRSGSSLSQDCARRVRLGFSGAARRPGSGGPEMTTKAGLAPVGVHSLTPHSTPQKGSWCRWWGPGTLQPLYGHKANLAPQAPLDPSGSPASAAV